MEITKEQKEAIEYLEKYTKWETYGERNLEKDIITVLGLLKETQIENETLEKLQKENEELKEENEYNKLLLELNNNFTIDKKTGNYKWNVIEIQKIKDKIEELNKEIKSCTEIDAIFKIKQEQILQELLESE